MFMFDVSKRHLTSVILFTVNYCLFANGDGSIRFNGKDENVVLEFSFSHLGYWRGILFLIAPFSGRCLFVPFE